MIVFLSLLDKILPLYLLIMIGFILGRSFDQVKWDSIGILLLYVVSPIVVFSAISNTSLDLSRLMLPVFFFCLCCLICLLTFYFTGKLFELPTKSLLAFTVGSGNTGYFGFPVAIALFGEEALGLAVLSAFGFILYENTLGFFMVAKGQYSTRESWVRLLSLPALYTFIVGIIVSLTHFKLPPVWVELGMNFRGAYTALGMMLIGLSIAQISRLKIDFKFISIAFFVKFVVWPFSVCLFIGFDKYLFHFFDVSVYPIMLLMSLVPLPVNSVAVAAALGNNASRQAAAAVLLSTLLALIYIPGISVFMKS